MYTRTCKARAHNIALKSDTLIPSQTDHEDIQPFYCCFLFRTGIFALAISKNVPWTARGLRNFRVLIEALRWSTLNLDTASFEKYVVLPDHGLSVFSHVT